LRVTGLIERRPNSSSEIETPQATHLLLEVGVMDRIPSAVSQSRCAEIRPMPSRNDLVVTLSVTALRTGS